MSDVADLAIAVDCCEAMTDDGCFRTTEEGWVAV